MRFIAKDLTNKGYIPLNNKAQPQTSTDATQAWKNFGAKTSVINALLHEQYHLCCYSEIRADQEGLGYHIEHVENKSQNPQRTFDPGNLAASAIDSDRGVALLKNEPPPLHSQIFGGHALGKAQGCDMQLFVSCFQANCATYFVFLSNGEIKPRGSPGSQDFVRADYTITQLNLNSPFLINRRRKWWRELLGDDEQQDEDLLQQVKLAASYLLPADGKLNRFFSLTRQFYGPAAEDILNKHAPELV
jgi:uncharacterized protein (TIGR02646 family)